MQEEEKKKLEEKKTLLKSKLEAEVFFRDHIYEMLELAGSLKEAGIPVEVEYIKVREELLPFLQTIINNKAGKFDAAHFWLQTEIHFQLELEKRFPSVNAFRYVPDLPVFEAFDDEGLNIKDKLPDEFLIQGENVFIFYTNFSVVLRTGFSEFVNNIPLFTGLPYDFCMVNAGFTRLLVRTLEGDWHLYTDKK